MTKFVDENVAALNQGSRLLHTLDDVTFAATVDDGCVSSVGAHVRHILDHYTSFLAGLASGYIDYDDRERLKVIELDRLVALELMERTTSELVNLDRSLASHVVRVCSHSEHSVIHTRSSVVRELDFLLNHTVHHYAIIGLLCRLHDVTVEPSFGVAPSTLHHQQYTMGHDRRCSSPPTVS